MAKAKKSIKYIVLAIAMGFFWHIGLPATHAAESSTSPTAPDCQLDQALDKLLAIKDADLSPAERNAEELNARKDVINQIIVCSNSEIDSYKNKLRGLDLTNNDPKDGLLRDKYAGDLDAASFYFNSLNDKLSATLTLDDVKQLAQDISDWRNSYYIPTMSQVNNFLLVIDDGRIIKTAKTRLDKIVFTLKTIKLSETPSLKQLLNDSTNSIRRGEELNSRAHEIVWSIDNVFSNASSTASSTSTEPKVDGDPSSTPAVLKNSSSTLVSASSTAAINNPNNVLPLVKDSLGEIKKVYADYLNISKIVKKILGL